jgi:urease accessory protein
MAYKVKKLQRDRARDLRNNMTEAEKTLWKALRREQLGVKFRRQVAVGPYIVDFLCHPAKLVIELDGGQHAEAQRYDKKRSQFIEGEGFEVLRFWNTEVLGNLAGVLQVIDQKTGEASKAPNTTNAPLLTSPRKRGEGRAQPMPCANLITHSHGPTDTVTLTYDARFLRRKVLTTDAGARFLVDLPHTTSLNHGDAFKLDDGRLIGVVAAPEDLLEITGDLPRLAWHIGNRHTPCQIEPDRLLVQQEPVMRDMLEKLGARLREVSGPFTPEGGAYGHGRTHGHSHG